jgi:hypothetical protein
MTRVFQPNVSLTLFRLSDAGELYLREEGNFIVISPKISKTYCTLVEAFLFYVTLEDEATLWDATDKPCFIERKVRFDWN